jgi:hypothetical protein
MFGFHVGFHGLGTITTVNVKLGVLPLGKLGGRVVRRQLPDDPNHHINRQQPDQNNDQSCNQVLGVFLFG